MSDPCVLVLRWGWGVGGKEELRALSLAAGQHGVLRRDQAIACGLSERQVDRRLTQGSWEALHPGVYRVEGSPRSWHQRLKAVSLWAFEGFALSHHTAAVLHRFNRYRGEPVELSATRNIVSRHATVHRVQTLGVKQLCLVDGFKVTSPTRTLLDLAAIDSENDVRASVDQALSRKWTSLEQLASALAAAPSHRGVRFLRQLVHEYAGGEGPTESELEARVLELFEAAGLPRPHRQRSVVVGNRLRRLDFALPGTPLVVEADGYAHHSSPRAFEDDRSRNNALIARGYRVLHWTWTALRDRPDELVAQLCQALRSAA